MPLRPPRLPALATALACAWPAFAHDVHVRVSPGTPPVLQLAYGDGEAFAYERYELLAAGQAAPVQAGRTDAQGRIAVTASAAAPLRLRAFAENGHGVDMLLPAVARGAGAAPSETPPAWADADTATGRTLRGLAGLALIGAGALVLRGWQRRRRRAARA